MLSTLVLTAGLGTRLDPLTRLVAKPAVPLAGATLIERVLGWLCGQGVREAVLNLHFRPETITDIVGDGRHLGLRVRYSWESPILGSAGGPRHALRLVDADRFLIVNGDTLCDMALRPMVEAHEASGAEVTLAVIPNPAPEHYNGIVADPQSHVVHGFVPKGDAAGSWHFVGIQIVQSSVFAGLTDGVPAETIAGVYREMLARGSERIHVWPVTRPFVDVGTPQDYLSAVRQFEACPGTNVVWAGASVAAGAAVVNCIVAGVDVPRGFVARDSILLPASVAQRSDRVETRSGIAVFRLAG